MNLIQFLRIFWARKWLILGSMLTCLAVAVTVASFLPKRYPGTARLMLDTIRPDPVTGLGVGGRDAGAYIRTQIEFIRDERVAGGAVDRLGLANDPATIAAYASSGFSDEDGGIRRWLVNQIRERTNATVIGSSILEIVYDGPTPEAAKAMAGALRDSYVAETLRLKTDTAGRTSGWYREQSSRTKRELEELEARRTAFMRENNITLVGPVGSLDSESAKLQALQEAMTSTKAALGQQQVAISAATATNPAADAIRIQLAAIEEEIARLSEQMGPSHPVYRAAIARRNIVQQQLNNALRQQGAAASVMSNASRTAAQQLEAEIAAQEQIVMARKPLIEQLSLLDREIELKQLQYSQEVARASALGQEAQVQETSFVILGDPQASRTPSYPQIGLVAMLASAVGLALGLLASLLLEFMGRRVRGVEDLSYATAAPVLATITDRQPSPLKDTVQRLLGRRRKDGDEGELQAI
jgi:uncharacterized protein involved in exopolysaccharide biosynthesis